MLLCSAHSPAGVFQDVALDDSRHDAVVVAHANVGAVQAVLVCQPLNARLQFKLSCSSTTGKSNRDHSMQ